MSNLNSVASEQAELCASVKHFDAFGDAGEHEDVVGHVAEHLREMSLTEISTRELLSTSVDELHTLRRGDIVRTATGKRDRVIIALSRANTPEELAELERRADAAGGNGPLGRAYAIAQHRELRDGKLFGPVRGSRPIDLRLIERAAR